MQFLKRIIKTKNNITNLILVLLSLNIAGCKATEAKPAGFIKNQNYMYKDPTLPFHRVWIRKGLNLNNYRRVMISPVNFNYLQDPGFVSKMNFHGYQTNLNENKQHLSAYIQQSLIKAFQNTKGNRFYVANRKGYGTIDIKIAVIRFVPTKSVINSATTAATFIPIFSIPMTIITGVILLPIKAVIRGTTDSGFESSAAVEVMLCDSVTNKVLVAFADRVSAPATIINIDDYSYWTYLHEIINKWSLQMVQLLNRKSKYHKIEGHSTFAIEPW